jgi:hypothetical protein
MSAYRKYRRRHAGALSVTSTMPGFLRRTDRPQSIFTAQTIGRGNHALPVENFQQLAQGFLGVARAPLDMLGEQQLCIPHGPNHQFFIGNADEPGDVHVGFPPRSAAGEAVVPVQARPSRLVPGAAGTTTEIFGTNSSGFGRSHAKLTALLIQH